jgi:two-component system response regulator FlrC
MKPVTRGTILVCDDEPGMRMALREVLSRGGWQVALADSAEAALTLLAGADEYVLLITDFRMPGKNGLELLQAARLSHPTLPSIMMTAFGTVEDAVTAMRCGASDYLLKPFSFETALEVVERVLTSTQANAASDEAVTAESTPTAARRAAKVDSNPAIIAEGAPLRDVLELAYEVADAEATVLLTGESGTGKEVIARYIHVHSGRRGPFVAVNCAALPEGLLESELFGHEKGAFTGAILPRKGRFEQAQGGTLLLDEITEMPLGLQAKLLRVLQEKEVTPVGGTATIKLDARIIATTNRDLEQAVAAGDFRQDLYYRLNVITLPLPALRERTEDILPLAEFFIKKYHRAGRPEQRLGSDLREWLLNNPWTGNVRELENLLERACLLARGEMIMLSDLHLNISASAGARQEAGLSVINLDATLTLEEMERRMILHTLDKTGGNRTRTADLLGVSVRTIRNKLHQYGISEGEIVAMPSAAGLQSMQISA